MKYFVFLLLLACIISCENGNEEQDKFFNPEK